MVIDAIESHKREHGKPPLILWASEALNREVVLRLPHRLKEIVCRSHTLKGISCATILNQYGDEEAEVG
jgi:hypothetical protein